MSKCLKTCNIKSLFNVPKISHISRKISQVSRFPAKSPDSRNKFVFVPKQPLLELSPPVVCSPPNYIGRRENRSTSEQMGQGRFLKGTSHICSVMFVQTFSVYTVRHALIFWWGSCRTGRPRDGNRVTTGDIYTGGGAVLVHCQACDDMK